MVLLGLLSTILLSYSASVCLMFNAQSEEWEHWQATSYGHGSITLNTMQVGQGAEPAFWCLVVGRSRGSLVTRLIPRPHRPMKTLENCRRWSCR